MTALFDFSALSDARLFEVWEWALDRGLYDRANAAMSELLSRRPGLFDSPPPPIRCVGFPSFLSRFSHQRGGGGA